MSQTASAADTAKLIVGEKELDLPIIEGTEKERAIDITKIRSKTGYITVDPGFGNTGIDYSSVTFIDGEKGILRYRGIPIEQLAEKASFPEVAYLLINGELPKKIQLANFERSFSKNYNIPKELEAIIKAYPKRTHPMAVLAATICSLSGFYDGDAWTMSDEEQNDTFARITAKALTLATYFYRHSQGKKFIAPDPNKSFAANFLNMMFQDGKYEVNPDIEKVIDVLLTLHADHEQNCSATTVRIVGSSQANIYAAISAGVTALWGPLHGGANQAVLEMLAEIQKTGDIKKYIANVKDKDNPTRLMGFGHRIYKNYDPRAKVIKSMADKFLEQIGVNDPLLAIAKEVEGIAVSDDYFAQRKLYPNVDFYTGIIYRALNIPTEMFTVMFALGRIPGWLAQWKEMKESPATRIGRPRQIYNGYTQRDYVPIEKR